MGDKVYKAAELAAKDVESAFYAKDLDRGYGQNAPIMLLKQSESAQIISSRFSRLVEAARNLPDINNFSDACDCYECRAKKELRAALAEVIGE